jgi:protein required for attachment to host cells
LTRINAPGADRRETVVAKEATMVPHHALCFVIADGGHARLVRAGGDNARHTVEALDATTLHQKTHDLVSDRAGRSYESANPARHAMTPRHDPHEMAKHRFAQAVAAKLNTESAAAAFQALVLVAPDHILADLRNTLDQPTAAKVVGTLAKDLTNVPDHDLHSHLKDWVGPPRRA